MNPIELVKEHANEKHRYREALQQIMLKAESLRDAWSPLNPVNDGFDELAAMARAALTQGRQ